MDCFYRMLILEAARLPYPDIFIPEDPPP